MFELTNPEWWRNALGLLAFFVAPPTLIWCLVGWGISHLERRGATPAPHGAPGPAVFAVALASGLVGVGILQAFDGMFSGLITADLNWLVPLICLLVGAGCLLAAQLGRSPLADACYTTAGGGAGISTAMVLLQDLSGRESTGLIVYIMVFLLGAITAALAVAMFLRAAVVLIWRRSRR